ncbi:MAG: hypothetical protein AAGA75_27855 [Cyanobacteria bacterium P01_E01_bin.6]
MNTQTSILEASRLHLSEHVESSSNGIRKLPYAPNQRVQFLHLQAETEALLQQLYLEQHRRRFDDHN